MTIRHCVSRQTNPQKEGETGKRTLTVPEEFKLFVLDDPDETVELVPEFAVPKRAAEEGV